MTVADYRRMVKADPSLLVRLSHIERMVFKQYLRGEERSEIALDIGLNEKQVDNAIQRATWKIRYGRGW